MEHNNLTIVSIYGHTDGSSAVPSIMQSMKELPGSKGLLLSLSRPSGLPDSIEWKPICNLDYLQYSVFVMHSLYAFIKTDYCLIVQDDSWVTNGKNFKLDYYNYDYIGAPSHCGKVGDKFYLGFEWRKFSERTVVQNGGFSLRSKKFLEAPNKFGVTHKQANDIHNWNEDAQLTAIYRQDLEYCGMKYAPEDIAKRFSKGRIVSCLEGGYNPNALARSVEAHLRVLADV